MEYRGISEAIFWTSIYLFLLEFLRGSSYGTMFVDHQFHPEKFGTKNNAKHAEGISFTTDSAFALRTLYALLFQFPMHRDVAMFFNKLGDQVICNTLFKIYLCHLFQNERLNNTITVKISSRPSSIQKLSNHFARVGR